MKQVKNIKIEILGPLGDVTDEYIIDIPKHIFFVQEDGIPKDFPKQDRAIITVGDKRYIMDRHCEITKL